MKKLLLATAVAAVMGSAQAAEMYSMDGVTINVYGEVEVNYIKTQSEAQKSELNLEEASFGFGMNYEMTEDFAVGSYMNIDANNDDDSVTRGDVYMALKLYQAHTITLGSQPTIFDDAGIGEDYEFGFTSYVDSLDMEGDQVIKYKYDGGEMFYGGVAYSAYRNETNEDDFELDGKIGARLMDLELTLFLGTAEHSNVTETAGALEARYTLGDLGLAATYARSDVEDSDDNNIFGVTATYWDGGRLEYAAGWANVDNDETVNDFYANVTYTFTDEVSAYAEVGFSDQDDTDVGYVVGLNANF